MTHGDEFDIPSGIHVRGLPADLDIDTEAHEAVGMIVPFGVRADIIERRGDGFVRYAEEFAPGALQRAQRAPHRAMLTYNHVNDLANRLGYGLEFWDTADGAFGRFRLDRSRAQQSLDILGGSHRGLSVGFGSIVPKAGQERDGDVVVRRSVHLDHVAAVPTPAYAEAGVLSARDGEVDEPTEAEKQAEAERQAVAEVLEHARQAVADGARWAKFRRGADGTPTGDIDAE